MESKGEMDFALKLNFPKIDYYFCCNRNNGSTYPKLNTKLSKWNNSSIGTMDRSMN